MAQVHSLDVPISKEPTWLWDTMARWMKNMKQLTLSSSDASQLPVNNHDNDEKTKLASVIRSMQWQLDEEMVWMRSYLGQLRSPVVFCHNVNIS